MGRSLFCLAPTGDGWGRRTTLAAMYGCIPVIVQDDVQQPFEDMLPYHRFSIRVKETDIGDIPAILEAIPRTCGEQNDTAPSAQGGAEFRSGHVGGLLDSHMCIPRLQAELACALRVFLWSSVYGSAFGEGGDLDAFAMTMLALREKVSTWVHREENKRSHIHSTCFLPNYMGCLHVHPMPICRSPCKGIRKLTSSGSMWPPGGALCKQAEHISQNTCPE
eukprot:CAMPEP_0196596368 /NCGR_PEP_ID=MMETSP1081-20130531/85664_1 /TAXON_ID=36882 /ORGANISM="Pyramimonas amylifera, Strain CCMP720" /LENGTH=219 /DNA_ID=CAMNT_0041921335 /DNA_START=101 /DNA_END=760 /DNA_ORIENTATION=+